MHIPFVDLAKQEKKINKLIVNKIKKIVSKGSFILGEEVAQFEKDFASYIGAKYCIGVASGTDAILLSLKAIEIDKEDEVIVPAFTFIASVSPIIVLGARPVMVDVLPDKPLIDYSKIEKAITKKTKAIIPVHLYGCPCDMDKISEIAQKYKLKVIEDACQAHGSEYKGKKTGSFGDISAFSFYPSKNLGALGDAGAIVTSNKSFAESMIMLRDHGQRKKYLHELIGYNSRLDSINAAALRIKLSYLDKWNIKRRKIAALYDKLLSNLPIEIPLKDKQTLQNCHLYVIRTKMRDKLSGYLKEKNIFCGIHYPLPLHLQLALKDLGYKMGDFPNAEKFAKTCLSLPIFPQMTSKEVRFVTDQIHNFFSR